MLYSEVSAIATSGLALATGAVCGWLFRSRLGDQLSTARSRSRHRVSATQINASTVAGKPAPLVIDRATEMRAPVESVAAPCVRNTFSMAMDRHLPESARRGDPLSLLLIRIDDDRRSSGRHGMPADDKLIEAVGKAFIASLRSTDWIARFDMTTFALLLPGTAHGNALRVAERLRKTISIADLPVGAAASQLALSIGTTDFVVGDSSATILRRAEEAMLTAVRAGGNCIRSRLARAQPSLAGEPASLTTG